MKLNDFVYVVSREKAPVDKHPFYVIKEGEIGSIVEEKGSSKSLAFSNIDRANGVVFVEEDTFRTEEEAKAEIEKRIKSELVELETSLRTPEVEETI